jgi:2,3-bisphosphoglycerate-independent phosphoglycerate mutase
MSESERNRPLVLVVLDGWGYSEDPHSNAIVAARTPVWDRLWSECPHTLLRASGAEVGLPAGQMGNSEVGHLNLGAGRVVYQEFTRVSRSIKTGSFFSNATLTEAVDVAIANDRAVHVLGLLSPGGVHSHEEHLHAMVKLAVERGSRQVYLHAFLDGRDTPPKSADASIRQMQAEFDALGCGRFASISGRFYAMDRDHRWPRVKAAYDTITGVAAEFTAPDAVTALELAYARGETDEFVKPTFVVPAGEAPVRMEDGDVVIFMNYRSDRARQLTRAFIEPAFDCFERSAKPQLAQFVSLTEYNRDFDIPVAFPPERLRNVLGEYVAKFGLHQLRIAETEKYAHVTFFFNGGREERFEWEERILIPSPQVSTYDQQPEMSALAMTDQLVEAIESGRFDVIICNYANCDMVGHTGNFDATLKAVEYVDHCVGRLVAAADKAGGELLVTADHGNAEQMAGEDTGQPHTAHTSNLVPLVYYGKRSLRLEPGILADVAPTMLELLKLQRAPEMTGRSLLRPAAEA